MKKILRYIILTIRGWILQFALKLRAKLKMASLREAITEADEHKAKTGRKTMVVFDGNDYTTVEKKQVKAVHKKYRGVKGGPVKHHHIHQIEKRSAYVTG